MSKTPNFDIKLKAILDATQLGERFCPISGERWQLDQDEIERCRAWGVPVLEMSPAMRVHFLGSWGAGVDLWWKPHMLTGKPILSAVPPDAMPPVITDKEYYSECPGESRSIEIDPNRPFFDLHADLIKKVPGPAFQSHGSVNTVGGGYIDCVNAYMMFGTYSAKDSWYSFRNKVLDDCMDMAMCEKCENSYSSTMCLHLNNCKQMFESLYCMNCQFGFDLHNCENCYQCANLRYKKFMYQNEQLSQDEYEAKMREINLSCSSSFDQERKKFLTFLQTKAIWPEDFNINSPGCSGEYVLDCIDSSGYFMTNTKNVRCGWFVFDSENLESIVIGNDSQDVYNSCVSIACQNSKMMYVCKYSMGCEYCMMCDDLEYCFGCIGLRKKKYCIFNKQYSEDEYWQKLDQLKCAMLERGEYGEFWPVKMAYWWPQYGFASLVYPFTDEELKKLDAPHFDAKEGMRYAPYPQDIEIYSTDEVPDCIADVGDEWAGKMFKDVEEDRRFTLNEHEIAYRKKKGYPFPRRHYRARFKELVRQVNSPERVLAVCTKCSKQIEINNNRMFPDRKVYCKPCYLQYLEEHG
ncbi:MAG: hypothetical protein ABIH21_05085 [Patescibacteria group bacterium]